MKKRNNIFLIGSVLLILFIAISIFTFIQSNRQIQAGYLASEGKAAENFAVLAAQNIHLTDEQVAKLKRCSYEELLVSEENGMLAKMMSNKSFANKVDYAYVMVYLPPDEVKYTVTEENQDRYDAPLGTDLDIMWLLDVNVSDDASQFVTAGRNISELNRYSYYIEEDTLIFGMSPTYIYNSSEWGNHICGYAPLYSSEGTYIGAVGVELQTNDYEAYCGKAMSVIGVLMTVSLLTLTLIFLYIYRKYRRLQFDKIYTDPLTQLSNRSYYNDQFIKYMNTKAKPGRTFALMIADIDLFKKVNDTFGHDIGDCMLVEFGELLLENFGKEHVVRFGGEEFVVGVWSDGEKQLRELLDLLFAQIAEHRFTGLELTASLSLGCAYRDTQTVNGWLLSGMLRAADCLLYESKENGRKQYRMERFDESKKYSKSE